MKSDTVAAVEKLLQDHTEMELVNDYLIPALDMLKQEGLFEKLDCKIAVGQGYRGKSGKLGVGNCTCRFEHFVKGCPPTEIEIYEYLKKYLIQY